MERDDATVYRCDGLYDLSAKAHNDWLSKMRTLQTLNDQHVYAEIQKAPAMLHYGFTRFFALDILDQPQTQHVEEWSDERRRDPPFPYLLEAQRDQECGLHAVNAFFGFPVLRRQNGDLIRHLNSIAFFNVDIENFDENFEDSRNTNNLYADIVRAFLVNASRLVTDTLVVAPRNAPRAIALKALLQETFHIDNSIVMNAFVEVNLYLTRTGALNATLDNDDSVNETASAIDRIALALQSVLESRRLFVTAGSHFLAIRKFNSNYILLNSTSQNTATADNHVAYNARAIVYWLVERIVRIGRIHLLCEVEDDTVPLDIARAHAIFASRATAIKYRDQPTALRTPEHTLTRAIREYWLLVQHDSANRLNDLSKTLLGDVAVAIGVQESATVAPRDYTRLAALLDPALRQWRFDSTYFTRGLAMPHDWLFDDTIEESHKQIKAIVRHYTGEIFNSLRANFEDAPASAIVALQVLSSVLSQELTEHFFTIDLTSPNEDTSNVTVPVDDDDEDGLTDEDADETFGGDSSSPALQDDTSSTLDFTTAIGAHFDHTITTRGDLENFASTPIRTSLFPQETSSPPLVMNEHGSHRRHARNTSAHSSPSARRQPSKFNTSTNYTPDMAELIQEFRVKLPLVAIRERRDKDLKCVEHIERSTVALLGAIALLNELTNLEMATQLLHSVTTTLAQLNESLDTLYESERENFVLETAVQEKLARFRVLYSPMLRRRGDSPSRLYFNRAAALCLPKPLDNATSRWIAEMRAPLRG